MFIYIYIHVYICIYIYISDAWQRALASANARNAALHLPEVRYFQQVISKIPEARIWPSLAFVFPGGGPSSPRHQPLTL